MEIDVATETLACGRDPLDVIDQARRGRSDAHTATCPFCQAVIGSDSTAAQYTQRLKNEPVQVPATLLPSVMNSVWSELRPGRNIPLAAAHGPAFATEQAVTSTVENELDQLPDFQVHTCQLHFRDRAPEEADPGYADRNPGLQIEIRAAAAYSVDLTALADTARAAAAAALSLQYGLQADAIDIAFVDVYGTEGSGR
ncbi:hypothetical protein [Nakamurella sp. PAMC28650]|uniref:hypothetical protein n=1 Tax=Nakamurella sp. PAMC28650 TaxID=2762325 RepID=UPI00164D1E1B|nr:hypothetical protein [Nakamurella sp. PAMC28650]QNK81788.1 hypothetical protein H7F38_03000 [Nakamurella sp. PAMC28650]